MSARTKVVASVMALVIAVAVAAVLALVERRPAPVSPKDAVPLAWQSARLSPMHEAHVERGKLACTACHTSGFAQDPTDSSGPKALGPELSAGCPSCHETEASRAHHGSDEKPTSCLTCHAFGAGKTAAACTSCHASVLHGGIGADVAGADGGSSAICASCHVPHGPKEKKASDGCASCHVDGPPVRAEAAPHVEPRGRHVAGHAACTTCHEAHRATKEAVARCESCHGDHRAATNGAAHAACTTCHTPHAPGEAKVSCASTGCHAGKSALAAPRVAAHADCRSCHDPHEPEASPALACVRCHEDVKPKHPAFASKTAGASPCVGCHAPHAGASAGARACSGCHTAAHSDQGFHRGGVVCTSCHKPHEFGSHLLRNDRAEEGALCGSCHEAKAHAVAARPGHAVCGGCHGAAHAPTPKPACATCHAQETKTAPAGHATCTQCHEAHSGDLGKHAECTSCHAAKKEQQHGAIPGGCASCHAPHGPKGPQTPPACSTCHSTPKLPGLHSISAHGANCASCHTSHGPPRSDRATCTSTCHADRRDHQPAAKVCKGCHIFRN